MVRAPEVRRTLQGPSAPQRIFPQSPRDSPKGYSKHSAFSVAGRTQIQTISLMWLAVRQRAVFVVASASAASFFCRLT
jgi:hypothetical protein